ncbi:hypothetical protein GECvBMG_gp225 [Salmonella phage GEC_vB_MG]|nr:hypothetical protein GECvBMG_gp225 [Salmonella phage GEC_vB_MG]
MVGTIAALRIKDNITTAGRKHYFKLFLLRIVLICSDFA